MLYNNDFYIINNFCVYICIMFKILSFFYIKQIKNMIYNSRKEINTNICDSYTSRRELIRYTKKNRSVYITTSRV